MAFRPKQEDSEAFESGRLHAHREWTKRLASVKDVSLEWLKREKFISPSHSKDEKLSPSSQPPSHHVSKASNTTKHAETDSILNMFNADTFPINARDEYETLIELLKHKLIFWRESAQQAYLSLAKEYPQKNLEDTHIDKSTSIDFILEASAATSPDFCTREREAALLAEIEALKGDVHKLREELDATHSKDAQRARESDSLRPSLERLLSQIQNAKREYRQPSILTPSGSPTMLKKGNTSTTALTANASLQRTGEEERAAGSVSDLRTDITEDSQKASTSSSSALLTSPLSLLEMSHKSFLELLSAFRGERNRFQQSRSKQSAASAALEGELSEEKRKNAELRARIADYQLTTRTQAQKLKESIEHSEKQSQQQREELAEITKRSAELESQKASECAALQARLHAAEENAECLSGAQNKLEALTRDHDICQQTLREAMEECERLVSRRNCQEELVVLLETELHAERENVLLLHTTLEKWVGYAARVLLTNIGLANQIRWRKLLSKAERVEQGKIREWLQQRSKHFSERGFPSQGVQRAGSPFETFKIVGIAVRALVRLKNLARTYSLRGKLLEMEEGEGEAARGIPLPVDGLSAFAEAVIKADADPSRRRRSVTFADEENPVSDDLIRPSRVISFGVWEERAGAEATDEVELVPFYPLLLSYVNSTAARTHGWRFPVARMRRSALLPVKLPLPVEFITNLRRLFRCPATTKEELMKQVPIIALTPMKLPSSGLNTLSRGGLRVTDEGGGALEKPSETRPTSRKTDNLRIPPSVIINHVLQSISIAKRRTQFGGKKSLEPSNRPRLGEQYAYLFSESDFPPLAPPYTAHILALNGLGRNCSWGGASMLMTLEKLWNHLKDENATLMTKLQERTKDTEAIIIQSERLGETLMAQRNAFEAEKREASRRQHEASDEASSLLHAAEANYERVREKLTEVQHNWHKELEGRRHAEEKVSRYQQQQFAHMAMIHQLRNEIRSLNMELGFFTGRNSRTQGFSDLTKESFMGNPNKVEASHLASTTLADITAAISEDGQRMKIHVDRQAQDLPKAPLFMSTEQVSGRECYHTPPSNQKTPSLAPQFSTPVNRVFRERGMSSGKAKYPFPGADFSAECPPSSLPFRSSLASSTSEFIPTPHPQRHGEPSPSAPPASTPPTLANISRVVNDGVVENSSVVSPLHRSSTVDPLHPTRGATYMHELLHVPSTDLNLQPPPPLSSLLNKTTKGMGSLGGMDTNSLATSSPAVHSPISLELYVPQVIRRQQQALAAQEGNTDQRWKGDLK